jgi:hypothetical protein
LRKYKERSKGEHNLKAVTYKVMHKERGWHLWLAICSYMVLIDTFHIK